MKTNLFDSDKLDTIKSKIRGSIFILGLICMVLIIAVRINVHGMGEVLGNLMFVYHKDLIPYATTANFIQISMGYVAIAMGMALFMIFSFFSLKRFETEEYMYHSLQLGIGLPVVLEICNLWPIYSNQLVRLKILAFSWGLNVIHPISLHRTYNLERPWVERFLCFYIFIILIFCLFITDDSTIRPHGTLLIATATGIGYNLSCHISALYNRKPYARIFSFSVMSPR